MEGDGSDEIVRTIVTLARNLRMDVVAEGVETEEQRQYLEGLDCDYVQGYLLSRPLDVTAVAELLRRHAGHRLPYGKESAERGRVSV